MNISKIIHFFVETKKEQEEKKKNQESKEKPPRLWEAVMNFN